VSYNVYERLFGMDLTPWNERWNEVRLKGKQASYTAPIKCTPEELEG
jgi:hypothetical protein